MLKHEHINGSSDFPKSFDGWTYDFEKGWMYNGKQHFHCEKCGCEDFVLLNGSYVCFQCSGVSRFLCTPVNCASS